MLTCPINAHFLENKSVKLLAYVILFVPMLCTLGCTVVHRGRASAAQKRRDKESGGWEYQATSDRNGKMDDLRYSDKQKV